MGCVFQRISLDSPSPSWYVGVSNSLSPRESPVQIARYTALVTGANRGLDRHFASNSSPAAPPSTPVPAPRPRSMSPGRSRSSSMSPTRPRWPPRRARSRGWTSSSTTRARTLGRRSSTAPWRDIRLEMDTTTTGRWPVTRLRAAARGRPRRRSDPQRPLGAVVAERARLRRLLGGQVGRVVADQRAAHRARRPGVRSRPSTWASWTPTWSATWTPPSSTPPWSPGSPSTDSPGDAEVLADDLSRTVQAGLSGERRRPLPTGRLRPSHVPAGARRVRRLGYARQSGGVLPRSSARALPFLRGACRERSCEPGRVTPRRLRTAVACLVAVLAATVLAAPAGAATKVAFVQGEQNVTVTRPGTASNAAVASLLAGPTPAERRTQIGLHPPRHPGAEREPDGHGRHGRPRPTCFVAGTDSDPGPALAESWPPPPPPCRGSPRSGAGAGQRAARARSRHRRQKPSHHGRAARRTSPRRRPRRGVPPRRRRAPRGRSSASPTLVTCCRAAWTGSSVPGRRWP